MSARTLLVAAAAVLWAAPLDAQQRGLVPQGPSPADTTLWAGSAQPIPVQFSFSGGISLGAYQAGVNWAMLEFLKRSRDDGAFRSAWHLPSLKVSAMTGASAGNINVMLAAVEYCMTRPVPAEESLFWRMWTESGWSELFPPEAKRSGDLGVLDRSGPKQRLMGTIRRMMDGGSFLTGCRVPLGVVVTSVVPGSIDYRADIGIPNQRHAGMFQAVESGGALRFVRPDPALLRATQLGSQVVLREGDRGTIELEQLFKLVEASSSYPVAFAPVQITYQTARCALDRSCNDTVTAAFMDGGVFDNNPVGLAVGMHRLLGDSSSRARIWYVSPGMARGRLAEWQKAHTLAEDTRPPKGVNALLEFVGGFIPSSRSYELQAFARSQQWLPGQQQAWIGTSSRAQPVIGEHLGAFAAFLGDPFREYDFYVGASDGFRYLAGNIVCWRERVFQLDPSLRDRYPWLTPDDTTTEGRRHLAIAQGRCADRVTRALAADPGFRMEPVGRYLVLKVLQHEDSSIVVPARGHDARSVVLDAIEVAADHKVRGTAPYVCRKGDVIQKALCADGFDVLLGKLREIPDAMHVLDCSVGGDCRGARPYPDLQDSTVVGFIRQPRATLDQIATAAFRQMRNTEKRQGALGEPEYASVVKLVEVFWRSALAPEGWRIFGPTSAPLNDGAWTAMRLLPFYGGVSLGTQGTQLGWLPGYYFARKGFTVSVPLEFARMPVGLTVRQGYNWRFAASAHAGFRLPVPILDQVTAGCRFDRRIVHFELSGGGSCYPEVAVLGFLRKLRVSGYRVPASQTLLGRSRLVGTVSLADVNGTLYWLLR